MTNLKQRVGIVVALLAFTSACSTSTNTSSRNQIYGSSGQPDAVETVSRLTTGENYFGQQMQVYLTGYSYWDNTPPGSAQIARPVIHRSAGGTGTYTDPVTLAVGHVKTGSRSAMDFQTGTRFYIERLRKYAIVEDLCGDGNRPQDGPCHSGYNGRPWIDIYVGGRNSDKSYTNNCTYRITGLQNVILNPAPGHPVNSGEITAGGCQVF